ncbi:dihydrolipoamide acetyltransferase family protein [Salibacter sp.]|uniref:dihydrolipoamide acetyltransferase family protein n=1 Tax=Salibacter sp. TaxID=2010995 RepID=UPI00286FCA09|nr:dihydrolipoamide acetyltransferase family protein [Salibacter sp.]MDR9399442.1 dihydrolipoamide acetyltransferase family protein [Salibacter sp.]MDR9486417.1 dihydrolipoamide acetyltransferase family protein [Salibacter sp.]
MAQVEVTLPKMGESVAEATITTWLKSEGDTVEAEESIVEIATDKVDSEVPAPADGVIKEIKVNEGDVAQVGDVIAVIEAEGEGAEEASGSDQQQESTQEETAAPAPAAASSNNGSTTAPAAQGHDFSKSDRFYSPLVKNIAKEEGISVEQLDQIDGSGQNGRVTKADILGFIENGGAQKAAPQQKSAPASAPQPKAAPQPEQVKPAKSYGDDVEVIEMERMRKIIAKNMRESKQISAHVTSFVEADVTNIVNWRNKVKNEFQKREGEKITFTPIFIEAIVKAIKDFPLINVSVDGDKIIRKKRINIGMAAATPSGNLIVPVIHDADQYNLVGLSKKVNDLANRARNNKLKPEEIDGGTYSISNVGSFGNVMGTPIIPQPQVAIMAVGSIQKKPAVIETEAGDTLGVRHMMYLSHSYDHRVVDGALGGMFVRRVADYLEEFDVSRDI